MYVYIYNIYVRISFDISREDVSPLIGSRYVEILIKERRIRDITFPSSLLFCT